jgi:hypothetical protein
MPKTQLVEEQNLRNYRPDKDAGSIRDELNAVRLEYQNVSSRLRALESANTHRSNNWQSTSSHKMMALLSGDIDANRRKLQVGAGT